uniref:S100P-binding protein n=1 Tax=Mola mola TaxID=94237 RepID=A0A3Q3VVT1_MOLML
MFLFPTDMDKADKQSTYSRMFTYDQKASVHQSGNPFVSIKTEMNNCERKRKLEDSGLDESYKSPAKKAFRRQALSLDLGCVVDTPPAAPDPAITREMKQTLSSQLGPKHMNCRSLEERDTNWNLLCSLKCGKPQIAPKNPYLPTHSRKLFFMLKTLFAHGYCNIHFMFNLTFKKAFCVSEDVMTELQNLMNRVADQTPGNSSAQWQHPSDLTRSYQRRFGNLIPSIPLHEWQANNKAYKRFTMIPNTFKRSQVS